MKRHLNILLLTILVSYTSLAAFADNRFYINDLYLETGKTATLEFMLENSDEFFGFQMDMEFPQGLSIPNAADGNLDITLSDRAAGKGYQLTSRRISPGHLRCGAISTKHMAFSGNSGVLLSIKVNVADNFAGGNLIISGIKFINRSDQDVTLADRSAKIGVSPIHIFLDPSKLDLPDNSNWQLSVTFYPDYETTDRSVTWTSSNETAVTVTDGNLSSHQAGKATITATSANGKTATCMVTVSSVTLNSTAVSLKIGENYTLRATVLPDEITDKTVTWESDDESVATVDENGKITPVSVGQTAIAATCGVAFATCTVTVDPTLAESITLSQNNVDLKVGESANLTYTVSPETTTNKNVSWTSDNTNVATVDATGKVTAKAYGIGDAVITATAADGSGVTATCTVKVVPTPASSITITPSSTELAVGRTVSLSTQVLPETTTDKTVSWTSSDETIASVDETGKVTAIGLGDAVITATANDGSQVTGTCTVSVVPIPAESVTLSKTNAELNVGETLTLEATVLPDDATNKAISWTSDDESVATVSADGTVTATGRGTTAITATCGSVNATCTLTVIVPAAGINISQTELTLKKGESHTLTAVVEPENANDKSITWTSDKPEIATVNESGNVIAVALGDATITATTSNGITATCAVSVVPTPAESVTLSQATAQLMVGGTVSLTATVHPDDTTDKSISWSSDKPEIATVDANGNVTAVALGTAIITATTSNGKTATCTVSVVSMMAASVTLDQTELSLKATETATLTATVLPSTTTDKSITWSTSDATVATVEGGVVTAIAVGSATITATCGEQSATCTVTVIPTPVTGITLDQTLITIGKGKFQKLTATVVPENATDKTVTWSSSNETAATVNDNGTVTALESGSTVITATTSNGLQASCTVNVEVPVTSIKMDTYLLVKVGGTGELKPVVQPEDATNKKLTWANSNGSVVEITSVDDNGNATLSFKAEGEATLTATSDSDPSVSAQCKVTVEKNVIVVTSISVEPTSLTLTEGEMVSLSATVMPDDATDKSVEWTSTDRNVAVVSETGAVTALSAGTAVIQARSSSGLIAECGLTVNAKKVEVTEVTLTNTELLMRAGKTAELLAIVKPDNATDKSVTWKSSDPTIASVDATGLVTAVSGGTATIYASSSNGLTAECSVTVPVEVTEITLTITEMTLLKGHTHELGAIIQPANATDRNVVWSSSDESVVTVDQNGNVTGVEVGNAIVSATSANGISAECQVTVTEDLVAVLDISLSESEITLDEGDSCTLTATLTPENATDTSVTWSSSDCNVATVSQEGVVTAVGGGTAVIYAAAHNGRTAECTVTVPVAVKEITLSQSELLMRAGKTAELIAIVKPDNATDKSLIWESSDPEVASVDENGTVTAMQRTDISANSTGTAVISVSWSKDKSINDECTVTVVPDIIAVTGIQLSETAVTLTEGETRTLTATVEPDNATDPSVTWKSSDRSVATVDTEGTVTAVAPGTAVIYASSSNGITAECQFTVTRRMVDVAGITLDMDRLVIMAGAVAQLHATVTPEDATDPSVAWTSDDDDIAIVRDGAVIAVSKGTTTVRAVTSNGLEASCVVIVTPRPLTPNKLLRKGDGSSCTFIAMMDISDKELAARGYGFVFGYTGPTGVSGIIEDSSLRYCHTTPEIYNDPSNDFWVYTYVINEFGGSDCSNLRHLDGREEICFDPSVSGYSTKGSDVAMLEDDEWMTCTESGIIVPAGTSGAQISVYTMEGAMVCSEILDDNGSGKRYIDLSRLQPGIYVVTFRESITVRSRKFILH